MPFQESSQESPSSIARILMVHSAGEASLADESRPQIKIVPSTEHRSRMVAT